MAAAIEADPVWQSTKGDYYQLPKEKHPMPGVAFGWSVLSLTGYDFAFRTTQSFAAVQPEVFYWDPPNEKAGSSVTNRAKLYDAVDLVWRNRVGETYNINPYLGRIQARTLVMHITNDLWLNFKLAERAVDRVPGAQLIAEESPVAHYGVFSIVNHRKNDPKFVAFMDDVASLDRAQKFDDKNYACPAWPRTSIRASRFGRILSPIPIRSNTRPRRTSVARPGRLATWTSMPAPTRIRRCWSSSTPRARSAGTTATSCSMRCAAACG